ncbi:MAG TPA: hypothetical protein VLA79_17805 [Polyangia bacterium]|nr:hypothetical protein [Polyangia bacterium]
MKLGRVVCSKFWAPLGLVLGLVTPVRAQPAAVSVPAADPLSPANLVAGPSLHETGKVGVVPESAATPAPTPVPAELQWAGNSEKSIQPVAADIADAPPPRPPEGSIDTVRLTQEIQANFETLENCRVDVARSKRVELSKVVADELLLRWTIEPSGQIGATGVVAATPVDLDLMDCVKAAMSRWSFSPPRGGAIHVERAFTFRRAP